VKIFATNADAGYASAMLDAGDMISAKMKEMKRQAMGAIPLTRWRPFVIQSSGTMRWSRDISTKKSPRI
jgi:hypothetical protein